MKNYRVFHSKYWSDRDKKIYELRINYGENSGYIWKNNNLHTRTPYRLDDDFYKGVWVEYKPKNFLEIP